MREGFAIENDKSYSIISLYNFNTLSNLHYKVIYRMLGWFGLDAIVLGVDSVHG